MPNTFLYTFLSLSHADNTNYRTIHAVPIITIRLVWPRLMFSPTLIVLPVKIEELKLLPPKIPAQHGLTLLSPQRHTITPTRYHSFPDIQVLCSLTGLSRNQICTLGPSDSKQRRLLSARLPCPTMGISLCVEHASIRLYFPFSMGEGTRRYSRAARLQ
jgi:hypothetical protein